MVLDWIETHLQQQTEPELLLLKGHLILEQCLNELLRSYMPKSGSVESLNFTFAKKLDVLLALGHKLYVVGGGGEEHIKEVNRIRNRLAHRLDYPELRSDLGSWACAVLGYTPKTMSRDQTYLNTVRKAFAFSAAFLWGVAETKRELGAPQ